jgi:histidinol-phosphate/aromatic aminotransferase/cobyric acid decarboxylase-like protein
LFERLLREGVIVRPTHGFGGPEAIRVTVGTAEENALLASALDRTKTT